MDTVAFIPARYASTRLPGKPLVNIAGKPLLQRVWENVSSSGLVDAVVVATDDERIRQLCREIGAECIMTPPELPSGSDRAAYAYAKMGFSAGSILNIQGDEPLLTGETVDKLVEGFRQSGADAGTLVKKIDSYRELLNPGVVKVTIDHRGKALYFSRSAIPFVRGEKEENWLDHAVFMKHIGIYIYKTETLLKFTQMPPSTLENAEKLEQLRLLQAGYSISCVETSDILAGVDTPEDIITVENILKGN